MNIVPVKTHKITAKDTNLFSVLDRYIKNISEGSILAVTSKIVSICEGRTVPIGKADKDKLIEQESQWYLDRSTNPYSVSLTITNNTLVATSGIDESNGDGNYVLWPKDPQKSAERVREHLKKRFNLKKIGVIITDSKTTPLRWGVTAIGIGFSGFLPLTDYIGTPDLFGRKFAFEKLSVIDSLATASAFVMGEGNEQTPLAIISDIPSIKFVDRNPTKEELDSLVITKEEDIYSPLLNSAPWKKGNKK